MVEFTKRIIKSSTNIQNTTQIGERTFTSSHLPSASFTCCGLSLTLRFRFINAPNGDEPLCLIIGDDTELKAAPCELGLALDSIFNDPKVKPESKIAIFLQAEKTSF